MIQFKQEIFNHYRNTGFPYFSTDYEWRKKELNKFLKFDDSDIIKNDEITQTMHGLAFCWSYMPHAYNVACNGFNTPLWAFSNDDIFKKVIDKRIKMGDNISDNGIRKMLKIYSGVQCVSNFRPTSASAIYNLFGKNKVVWDMSCGYGGRLLGAYKAGVKKYIGTEPCTETFNGLNNIINDFMTNSLTEFELHKLGSEDFIPNEEIDLCFTSPPYFNTEKYSDEDTQSWKKYETKELWLNDFLGKTLENCYQCLKKDGFLIINIANVKSYKNIEEDFVNIAKLKGFKLINIMKYNLSSLSHNDKFKFEPVFIMKK
jgi:SAM-dependent methyltransferase